MLCIVCEKENPVPGKICPYCQYDKSQDRELHAAGVFGCVVGALVGGFVSYQYNPFLGVLIAILIGIASVAVAYFTSLLTAKSKLKATRILKSDANNTRSRDEQLPTPDRFQFKCEHCKESMKVDEQYVQGEVECSNSDCKQDNWPLPPVLVACQQKDNYALQADGKKLAFRWGLIAIVFGVVLCLAICVLFFGSGFIVDAGFHLGAFIFLGAAVIAILGRLLFLLFFVTMLSPLKREMAILESRLARRSKEIDRRAEEQRNLKRLDAEAKARRDLQSREEKRRQEAQAKEQEEQKLQKERQQQLVAAWRTNKCAKCGLELGFAHANEDGTADNRFHENPLVCTKCQLVFPEFTQTFDNFLLKEMEKRTVKKDVILPGVEPESG